MGFYFFSVRTYVLGKNLICDYREIIFDSNSPIFFNNCFSLIFVSLEFPCLGIRAAWDRRNEFQITESVQYYFNKIDSIKMPNYIPDKVREENQFIFNFPVIAFLIPKFWIVNLCFFSNVFSNFFFKLFFKLFFFTFFFFFVTYRMTFCTHGVVHPE